MNRYGKVSIALALLLAGGCGAVAGTDFSNRLIGADGQLFVLEDLEEIANDPDADEDEKRALFREIGIEDEKLIDALLDL